MHFIYLLFHVFVDAFPELSRSLSDQARDLYDHTKLNIHADLNINKRRTLSESDMNEERKEGHEREN